MGAEYFLFVHNTASPSAKLSTWCFEHSNDISPSLLINRSHTDESWEARNSFRWIYTLNLSIEHSGEHWWEQHIFCWFATPQAPPPSWASGALNTLVTSIFLYSSTRATLMSPRKDESHLSGYTLWISSLSSLENTDENTIVFARSPHHKHFGKAQHLVLCALWWHHIFSTC